MFHNKYGDIFELNCPNEWSERGVSDRTWFISETEISILKFQLICYLLDAGFHNKSVDIFEIMVYVIYINLYGNATYNLSY